MTQSATQGVAAWIGVFLTVFLLLSPGPIHALEDAGPDQSRLSQARLLRADGEFARAIEILRAALRSHPNDIPLREELGYTLILDGQMAAAQYQFEILAERNHSPELNRLYRSVLNRIVAERPFGVSVILGFTPSDNINQGTDNKAIENDLLGTGTIDPANRRIAGWNSRIGLKGYARTTLSPAIWWCLTGAWSESSIPPIWHRKATLNSAFPIHGFFRRRKSGCVPSICPAFVMPVM
ncbi:tetratricopeptide repeat protein [Sulfitobacter pacificus]|uniref:tetratricopeptide repeat protein n=1 Tax=Sulfitobacter pacificus TaxID=1499314 RepID=UPI00360AAB82